LARTTIRGLQIKSGDITNEQISVIADIITAKFYDRNRFMMSSVEGEFTFNNIVKMTGNRIENLGNPINLTDATNKSYVDSLFPDVITREEPSGLINGSNSIFTLMNIPYPGSENVYLNGILQNVTSDYTITDNTITFVVAPITNDKIRVTYLDGSGGLGGGGSVQTNGLNTNDGTIVNVSNATKPATGQILKATSATSATWQNESGGGSADTVIIAGLIGTFTKGKALYISSNDTLSLADNTSNNTHFVGFSTGVAGELQVAGKINGFTGLIAGSYYLLGTSGDLILTGPTASGTIIQRCLYSINATEGLIVSEMSIENS